MGSCSLKCTCDMSACCCTHISLSKEIGWEKRSSSLSFDQPLCQAVLYNSKCRKQPSWNSITMPEKHFTSSSHYASFFMLHYEYVCNPALHIQASMQVMPILAVAAIVLIALYRSQDMWTYDYFLFVWRAGSVAWYEIKYAVTGDLQRSYRFYC